jgi:hypothetical protein
MRLRKWWFFPVIFFLVLLASGFNGFSPIKPHLLKMHLRPQHRDWWCWAASTEMVSEYLGHRVSQCDSVMNVTGVAYCTETCECETGWGPFFGADLNQVKDNLMHWGFKFKHLAGPLGWSELTEDIFEEKCPVIVGWYYMGGGGHFVVVNGYAQFPGRHIIPGSRGAYVFYKNPWPPDCEPGDGFMDCTAVPGGDEAVSTHSAFVNDGVHSWGETLHLFKVTP